MYEVEHPSHYAEGRKFEPVDVIADWGLPFCLANALKYISRAGRKGDAQEDLEKAIVYLKFEIARLRGAAPSSAVENKQKTAPLAITVGQIWREDDTGADIVVRDIKPDGIITADYTKPGEPTRTIYETPDEFRSGCKLVGYEQEGSM